MNQYRQKNIQYIYKQTINTNEKHLIIISFLFFSNDCDKFISFGHFRLRHCTLIIKTSDGTSSRRMSDLAAQESSQYNMKPAIDLEINLDKKKTWIDEGRCTVHVVELSW